MALLEINTDPTDRELRQFARIWLPAFLAVVGGLLAWRLGWWTAAVILWCLAGVALLGGLIAPGRFRLIYAAWMRGAQPIGWVVSHLVMAIVYYGVVTPIGLLLRLLGRDPMTRRLDRSARSYWVEHTPGGRANRYFRQF